MIEAISVNVNSILQKVTGSWKKKIPSIPDKQLQ